MNRFLTLTSSTLIATGFAVLPIAAFAQTASPAGTDAAKTPTAMTTTAPAVQAPAATAAKKDTVTGVQTSQAQAQAHTQTQVKPGAVSKGETRTPAHGTKNEVHSMNSGKAHPAAKTAPAQDQKG